MINRAARPAAPDWDIAVLPSWARAVRRLTV